MRKFLLSAVALLMSICMLAGDGSSKANAIDFDWANGHKPALSANTWYRVDLSHMKNEANDPTLALYLTNLTDQTASVSLTLEASLLGQSMSQKSSYNIAGKDYQLWSRQSFDFNGRTMSLKQLMSAGLSEVYLQLTSSKEIALSAKVYETEEIVDDACTKAKDFNWSGVDVEAGEQWYRLNLAAVKETDNKLKFVVTNNGTVEANVAFDMSLDCPASAVIEKDWVIAAGADMEDEFGRVFLDVLKEDYVYLKLTNDQPLTLRVEEEVVVVPPGKYDAFDCATAPELAFDTELALTAGQHVYKVKRNDLLGGRSLASEFSVTNNGATAANLDVEVAFACPVKSTVDQHLVIEGNTTVVKAIKDDVLKAVDAEWVYIRFITDQDLTATVGKRNTDPCVNAVPFDWTVGASLAAGESQWYEVNIASLKQDKKHLTLAFTNHSDNIALVNVEVALDCDGTILPITLPIYRNLSVAQTIDYNLLKHVPLDRIYVGVSTDSHIEMAASVKDAIAADPSPCLNAINPVHGVEYTHEANTTNWYKISLDLLESTTDYSSIYLANKGNQRAHVTIGVVTDCQYTPSSRITLPMPSNFDLGMLAPNMLGRLLKELARIERVYNKVDSKDIYLEIQSDQPIGFGLDVVNPITSPCLRSDLITFDWNKGAKVEKGDGMKWFDMDLDAVKAAGKHVKLTFTNHTDSLVWAATMVSVECPAKLTMPLLVPVPAGMSIDHVINYQLFAVADLHNIYIGVLTDGALELKSESIDATILPPADCLSAQKIVSGQEYVQNAGTQWYQFPMSLIDEMGGAAKISFKNLTSNHATLSAGVTVGCEYPAHTVAKAIAPKSLEFSVNLPKAIIAKVRGLIDPALTDFYVQLTTDQKIAFTLNNHATDVRACASATAFDWNSWETGGLQLAANQENWYKVNLGYPLQQLRNGEDITIAFANSNPMDVEVELAVSPTCPVVLSLEKSLTIPAGVSASATLSYDKLVNFVAQYDKFNLLDRDYAKLMEQINAYALYNKLNQLLEEYGYDDNVPLYRIEPLIDRYGQAASLANLKQLLENPRKYISVAEIKQHLQQIKDRIQDEAEARLTLDNLLDAFDKYGDKIPYVDAEQLINNADLLLPYVGSAQIILDKCKQYISKDDFRAIVDRCKQLVPFEELNQLFNRVEDYIKQRLPEPNTIYLYVKSTGDLVIAPEIPAAPKCEGTIDTIPAVACDAFVWKGEKYTESGIYRDTISASNIADAELLNWKQVIKLSEFSKPWYKLDLKEILDNKLDFTLSLNNDLDTSLNYSLELYTCDMEFMASQSATVDAGIISRTITYEEFEDLMDGVECEELYLRNVNYDCERIEELHLTINKSVATEFAAEACESYEWNGQVYAASGDYVDTLTTIHGCDSIVTLHLTINKSVATEFAAEACESYEWNGQAYTASGDYVDTLTTIHGCDSIVTLHLTINKSVATEFAAEACESYTWNGQVYTASGDYVDTLTTINGCDSIVTMHLTINTPMYKDVYATICYGEGYEWAGEWKYDAGTYADTLTTVNGCDSIVTLHLTIENCPSVVDVYDTIEAYVCDGTEYISPYTGEKHIISSLVPATLTWEDVVVATDTIFHHAFVITPIVAPALLTDATLATISGATPVLTQGLLPDVTGTAAAIKAYYAANDADNIADVTDVYWDAASLTTKVVCGALTHTMTLIVETDCDNVLTTTHTFDVPVLGSGVEEYMTICAGDTYTWNGTPYTATGTYQVMLVGATGCDSLATLNLTVLPAIPETVEEATICAGETYTWNGKTYNSTTTESITLTSVNGCDSVVTLKLVVLPAIPETVEEATICAGETYTWNGKTYNSTTTESITLTSVNGCDSVVTLKLTVLPEATTEYEDMIVCEGDLPIVWRGQVCATVGTYTVVDTYANTGCDSVTHILNLQTYVLTAPAYVTTPVAVCGNPVDVTAATADIKAHIASESNYAPNATVTWYIQMNGAWVALTEQLLKGTDEAVTLKYVIASDCGEVSDTFDAIPVEMPTPANDVDMDNIQVVSKYDNRVLLLHLNAILATHGWTPEPEEVKWYRVVNELDTYGQPGDDEFTGITGHYFNYADASVMDGQYYALIVHTTEGNAEECDTYMRTEVITCTINKVTPRLLSNVARPDDNLTLINLNPEMITEIRVYSTTGELMATYTADQVEEFIFKAAHISGYYMVDVETEDNKVTLRYVVK